jgi:hypothetical protein
MSLVRSLHLVALARIAVAAGVGIAAGTLSAGLAFAGIHQEKGGSSPFDFESNMLAEFFDRPTLANRQYPSTIWIFLNETSPYGPLADTQSFPKKECTL